MGYRNREIESKLLVEGTKDMGIVDRVLKHIIRPQSIIKGYSSDSYWGLPKNSKNNFGRVRYKTNGGAQLTVKRQDKGSYRNRVEVDVEVDDPKQAVAFMKAMTHRDSDGSVKKNYIVYFLENGDTTVSIYKVTNDSRVFVEVEARTEKRMYQLVKLIRSALPFKIKNIDKSLYRMFVAKS